MMDVAAHLIPFPFFFFGERIRATQDRLNNFQAIADLTRSVRSPDWVTAVYQNFADQVGEALAANRGTTDVIAACQQYNQGTLDWAPVRDNNPPAAIVYQKPLIILIDEFSISAADIFPSMMQDNGRGKLTGMRTNGSGGAVSPWATGFYSESNSSSTNTLVVRKNAIVTPDLPAAPYVENIGARPDIELNYMTRENLMTGGRAFVDAFTAIAVEEIRNSK